MADRVYPSAKPNPQPPASTGGIAPPPSFPATKSQLYQRPMYRPAQSKARRRSRGSCCRRICLWILLVIVLLVLLAAIAGGIFYFLYRPHRPTFTVSSVRLSALNVTASNLVTSNLNLSIAAYNPNKKIVFLYDDFSVGVSSGGADLGDGSIPGFRHDAKNTTVLKASAGVTGQSVDPSEVSDLKKSNVQLAVDLETKAGVKLGSFKTKKVGIKVHCEGIQVAAPAKGKAAAAASTDATCQVKLRVKIWKWTF